MKLVDQFFLNLIRFYQMINSIIPDGIWERGCRFTPSCSSYTYAAINKYGTIKGLNLGLRRILRCHPWSKRGYDPVK